jgi:ribose transport system permease protein
VRADRSSAPAGDGALILTQLTTILAGRGYDAADQQIIFGVLILGVVAGYGRNRRLRDRV